MQRIAAAAAGAAAVASTVAAALGAPPVAAGATPVDIAAVGDIACAPPGTQTAVKRHQGATADQLVAGGYAAVLAVGDEQYPCGLPADFAQVYDRSWGRVRATTYPVPGDNEYVGNTGCSSGAGADGYFAYFGDRATPRQPGCRSSCGGYYSVDIGAWHMVALNSECDAVGVGGCATSSAQYRWLQQDLATHPNVCTLAYMHKPFWGNATKRLKTKALVQLLYDSGAEVLVSGHDHLYVRFAPQSPTSVASSTGLRQFVVGTGGVSHTKPKANLANTQAKDGTHFGVLRLTLNDSSYDWAFLPDSGGAALDSGSDTCHWPN